MRLDIRVARFVAVLSFLAGGLGVSARSQTWTCDPATTQNQICVGNPVSNGVVNSTPVWLRAHVNSCANSNKMIGFGYSINNENFYNQGITNFDIDTTDYRLVPGQSYTIWYKAWSQGGMCTPVPITFTVNTGETWNVLYENVNAMPNAPQWQPPSCPYYTDPSGPYRTWFWNWDAGTAQCTDSNLNNTNSYSNSSLSPTFDNQSRDFFVTWTGIPTVVNGKTVDNPSERYSLIYANNTNGAAEARNFVYDAYIYLDQGPDVNIYALQMDTNQVGTDGNLVLYGLQCVSSQWDYHTSSTVHSWQYTDYRGWITPSNDSQHNQTVLGCDQLFIPKMWHHVQLKTHTDGSGGAYYDSITVDGTTTQLANWFGNSSTYQGWPVELFLNFQIDGMYNGGAASTALVYVDGMTMIWW